MSNLGEAGSAFAMEVCMINFLYQFSSGILLEQNWLCQLLLQLVFENAQSQSDDRTSPRITTEVKFSSLPVDCRTELSFAATVSFRNSFQVWQAQKST